MRCQCVTVRCYFLHLCLAWLLPWSNSGVHLLGQHELYWCISTWRPLRRARFCNSSLMLATKHIGILAESVHSVSLSSYKKNAKLAYLPVCFTTIHVYLCRYVTFDFHPHQWDWLRRAELLPKTSRRLPSKQATAQVRPNVRWSTSVHSCRALI